MEQFDTNTEMRFQELWAPKLYNVTEILSESVPVVLKLFHIVLSNCCGVPDISPVPH